MIIPIFQKFIFQFIFKILYRHSYRYTDIKKSSRKQVEAVQTSKYIYIVLDTYGIYNEIPSTALIIY